MASRLNLGSWKSGMEMMFVLSAAMMSAPVITPVSTAHT